MMLNVLIEMMCKKRSRLNPQTISASAFPHNETTRV
jgi:hypothetical protein